jgi:hypothetical protein
MPDVPLTCQNCGGTFQGRPNRLHCSVGCRRQLEMRRRDWEEQTRRVRWLELNARSVYLTKKQRASWQAQFEAANAKLGPRP